MKRIVIIASVLTLGAASVLAQEPGPGTSPARGGLGQGQEKGQAGARNGRFGRMRGRVGGIRIITRSDVQKELNLNDQQKAAIQEKFPALGGQRYSGAAGKPSPAVPPGGPPAGGNPSPAVPPGALPAGGAPSARGIGERGNYQEMQQKLDVDIKAILNEGQYKRLHELMLQFDGPSALADNAELAKKLGVTEEQQTKIRNIRQTMMQNMRDKMQGAGAGGDRQAMMAEMQKMREETNKQILDVLTSEQKNNWDAMLGKPFKFEGR